MQKKLPQGTTVDRQMYRSNSVTFGLQPYDNQNGYYSTSQQEGSENCYDQQREYTLARTTSKNGFEIITEESQCDTEISSQSQQSNNSYQRPVAKSFGKWNKKCATLTESCWSKPHHEIPDGSHPKTVDVNKAINTLKNYQLNVVVDMNSVIVDKENVDGNGRTLTTISQSQNYLNYRKSELPQRPVEGFFSGYQSPTQYDCKKKNITYDNSAILAEKYRNLEKSYDFLKNEVNRLQVRKRKQNVDHRQQNFYKQPQLQQQFKTQQQFNRSFSGQYLLESKLQQQATRQTRQNENLRSSNEELKQQLEEVYKLNRAYKRQADICLNTAQNLQNQLQSMKSEITYLKDENARLEELYQSSVTVSKQLNKKHHQSWPKQEEKTTELHSYIRELEAHIENENNTKSIFMEQIIGYKLNYNALEEENKKLREIVRRCEVQHQPPQQNWTPASLTSNQQQNTFNLKGYVCPYQKYGVPKLIISPPEVDESLRQDD